MKKLIVLITIMIVAIATVAQATPVVFGHEFGYESVTELEFNTMFNSVDNLAYADFQAGGSGASGGSPEIIVGDYSNMPGLLGEVAQSTWDMDNNPNSISVEVTSGSTFTASHGTDSGSGAFLLDVAVNEVWIGLWIDTGIVGNTTSLVNQTFDGVLLTDMVLDSTPGFVGAKFSDSNRPGDIGEHVWTADFLMEDGSFVPATGDNIKVTYLLTNNPAIVPEPNTLALVMITFASMLALKKIEFI